MELRNSSIISSITHNKKYAMSEKSKKKQKKCFVSDEEISTILHRYTPTTVLALLQEVAQVKEVDIDWNALVKKTKTGIKNAREYQMLWRHLAYRHELVDGLLDGDQPLDDDSDLEYELEPYLSVSSEASVEAAACVKVLIASGTPNGSKMSDGATVEAPLTLSIPNGQRSSNTSETSYQSIPMQGSNIIVPVSVPKNSLPNVISTKGLDTNVPSSAILPPRQKRKLWSEAEDMELIAAVKKHGEGNWASISRGDFKGSRTAPQLKKRWKVIRSKQGGLIGNKPELSEIHLAHQAVSRALDLPIRDTSKASCSIRNEGKNANAKISNPVNPLPYDTSSLDTKSQHHGQQDFASKLAPKVGILGPSKSLELQKPSTKPIISTNSMVKAAAVAAGACIASPSDAASLLKAARSKDAVHIIPGGGPVIKSSFSSNTNASSSNGQYVNPASTSVQSNLVGTASGLNVSTKVFPNGTNTNPAAEHGIKAVEDTVAQKNQITCTHISLKGDHIIASTRNEPSKHAQGEQIGIPRSPAREKIGMTCSDDPLLKENRQGNHKALKLHSN